MDRSGPEGKMEVRYLGFDQLQNARAFRFDIMVKGAAATPAVVTADMTLFLQYRVSIQNGPNLCAAKLTSDLERNFYGDHVLTGDDLRAFSESRTAAEEKRNEARRSAGRRSTRPAAAFENPRGHM